VGAGARRRRGVHQAGNLYKDFRFTTLSSLRQTRSKWGSYLLGTSQDRSTPQDDLGILRVKEHCGLARCDRSLRLVEAETDPASRHRINGRRRSGLSVADLCQNADRTRNRLSRDEMHASHLDLAGVQLPGVTYHHLASRRVQGNHIEGRGIVDPQASSLADREVGHSLMASSHDTARVPDDPRPDRSPARCFKYSR